MKVRKPVANMGKPMLIYVYVKKGIIVRYTILGKGPYW